MLSAQLFYVPYIFIGVNKVGEGVECRYTILWTRRESVDDVLIENLYFEGKLTCFLLKFIKLIN